ncbi:vegetative specific protein H5 [Aspergillus udagawae]|uniref:Vegetative specific protein H5 n=1 Tax=Aspergillus udagawae TaxID=91492 RepID=A0ABQ1AV31_9EURO|nr:vegetative specific protein H5 [Aspergillus udagawae]GFF88603.1 vegetative specific protein H5 [Aspergillus udagawae]GFG25980.1 vegetative specific protein H5 [Aspergillus udagawae]
MMHYLDPQNASFATAIVNEPAPHQLGAVKGREALEVLQKHEAAPDILTEAFEVPGKCGPTSVVIVRSKSLATKQLPMVFYTHGGGWILGSPASFAPLLEDSARRTGAAIVFPCYTPAPEKQFPFQFEQTYEVLDYMVRHGSERNLIARSIALAGDSVGGHMAIAMVQMSLERSLPAEIAHVVLFYPVTDTHKKLESYKTFKDGPFLLADTMDWMIAAFIPERKDRETALASPLSFLSDDVLSRFPPTTVFLSAVDPLLDEGMAFGQRLQKAGVDAAVIRAEGQMHAFVLLEAIRDSPTARAIMDLAALRLRTALPSTP